MVITILLNCHCSCGLGASSDAGSDRATRVFSDAGWHTGRDGSDRTGWRLFRDGKLHGVYEQPLASRNRAMNQEAYESVARYLEEQDQAYMTASAARSISQAVRSAP